jgi:hypothetical protein
MYILWSMNYGGKHGENSKCISATDRLFGLVVRVPGYRSGGPGSILGATWFPEK